MSLFQMLFVPVCVAAALWAAARGLRGTWSLRQSGFWGTLWALAAVMIAVPETATVAARSLGIGRGSDLVSYAAVLAGIAACVYFYQRYRRLEILCTELLRREAVRQAERGGQPEEQTADMADEEERLPTRPR